MKRLRKDNFAGGSFLLLVLFLLTLANFVVGPLDAPDWAFIMLLVAAVVWSFWLAWSFVKNRGDRNKYFLLIAVPLGLLVVNADRLNVPTWMQVAILIMVIAWGVSALLLRGSRVRG